MFDEVTDKVDKWHLKRWGMFTSSENYKLLVGSKIGGAFGDTAMSYIETKAMEMCTVMWEKPKMDEVKAFLHGGMYEYPAFRAYINKTGYEMTYLGSENPVFIDDESLLGESGGSPDSLSMNDDLKITRLAEIKCPFNPMNHFLRLKWKTQWDIREGSMQAYCQMQHLLKITGAPVCDFISYDERMKDERMKLKIIEVYPDKKFQDNLHFRILKAIEEKYKIINEWKALCG